MPNDACIHSIHAADDEASSPLKVERGFACIITKMKGRRRTRQRAADLLSRSNWPARPSEQLRAPFVLPSCRSDTSAVLGGYYREQEIHGVERRSRRPRCRTTTPEPFHFDGLGAPRTSKRRRRRCRRRRCRRRRHCTGLPDAQESNTAEGGDATELLQALLQLSGVAALQVLEGELKSLDAAMQALDYEASALG